MSLLTVHLPAQQAVPATPQDTLQKWRSRFFTVSLTALSPDGRWAAVSKWLNSVCDTVMLVDTQNPGLPPLEIVKMMDLRFAPGNRLLSAGAGGAAWWDLSKRTYISYPSSRQAVLLEETGRYAVLGKDRTLKVMSADGKIVGEETGVEKILADGKSNLYFLKQAEDRTELYLWNEKGHRKLYTTPDTVERAELTPSGKYLTVQLKNPGTGRQNAVLITALDGSLHRSFPEDLPSGSSFSVSEAGTDGTLFIRTWRMEEKEKKVVELWYGNDGDLKSILAPKKSTYEYAVYHPLTSTLTPIPSDVYPTVANIGSSRYFLAFKRAAGYNYVRYYPDVEAYVYDAEKETFQRMGPAREEIVVPKDGSCLLYRSTGEEWALYDPLTHQNAVLGKLSLGRPVFSADSRSIWFEGKDGLRKYSIAKARMEMPDIAAGHTSRIISSKDDYLIPEINLHCTQTGSADTLVLKLVNTKGGKTSYGIWSGNRFKQVLGPTENSVQDIRYDAKMRTFVHREENYNRVPQVIAVHPKTQKTRVVYQNPNQDVTAGTVRQEVITYSNAHGVPLKGLLYYPAGFDSRKTYPMVVHIYQIQSGSQNRYTVPGEMRSEGFDLKALLAKGYFVYLPDIRTGGTEGPGLSALNCVNSALDAIANRAYIDRKRVGLVGHSHGGYETSFIATHSTRFAAYIAGSGPSDIIRSYYTFSYNYFRPYYWQYENGQMDVKMPFADNKALYYANSPVQHAEKASAPILLWAGKKDRNVDWDQVMEFYIALRRYQKEVIALFYPEKGHDVGDSTPEMKDLNIRVLDWWDYFLKGRKDIPWIQQQMKKDAG
ncbi:prolyl oligopeptidase family serine peptidase [Chryseobacterium sp.]|uniref:prolyl oligopeptidase family serine peptidase n=1 Tax=Chryseobacterium sp. TaxID=1871047 RepID=UPI00162335DE|nr:prolyl oligopeptidase family serine peptidase [Chryseobacterium sp.]